MGRTYRRNGDDYNSYGKSLREKRQRGNIRNNGQDYDYAPKKRKNKNWDTDGQFNYDGNLDGSY